MSALTIYSEFPGLLALSVALTFAVVFVNGWTDAPNAIATCVTTRCLSPTAAIIMAAVCNLSGALAAGLFFPRVAVTIGTMADFGSDNRLAITALCAALVAIVVWAVAAWVFGIPTSESHALIAGLCGAAIGLRGVSAIVWSQWLKVIYGLLFSVVGGIIAGFTLCKAVILAGRRISRRQGNRAFSAAQIFGAAANGFMHGAQDGQKFMGILQLAAALAGIGSGQTQIVQPFLLISCSVVMCAGTCVGGKRIIRTVGRDMVRVEKYQGFAADTASALCLLTASLAGMPVSTTHTKTTALIGVGLAKRRSSVNFKVFSDMFSAWLLTFPGCGIIGYAAAKAFTAAI